VYNLVTDWADQCFDKAGNYRVPDDIVTTTWQLMAAMQPIKGEFNHFLSDAINADAEHDALLVQLATDQRVLTATQYVKRTIELFERSALHYLQQFEDDARRCRSH
jgi:hypothetical protein